MRAGKTEYSGEQIRKPEKATYTREDQKGNEMVSEKKLKRLKNPMPVGKETFGPGLAKGHGHLGGSGPLGTRRKMVHYPKGV